MKFLTYAYIWLTLPAAWFFAKAWQRGRAERITTSIALLIILGPGVQAIWMDSTTSYIFTSNNDLAVADYISRNLPKDQTILTSDRHNNPIPTLTGRPIVMGYRGWLSSYGIDYQTTESEISQIWSGEEGSQAALQKHDVKYLALSHEDAIEIGVTPDAISRRHEKIYDEDGWYIWRIDSL